LMWLRSIPVDHLIVYRGNPCCKCVGEAPVPQAPKSRLPARGAKNFDVILLIKVLFFFIILCDL